MFFLQNYRTVLISNYAKKDLIKIGAYTKQNWGNSQKQNYLKHIKKLFQTIRGTPELGIEREDISPGLRSYPAQKHIIFYRQTKKELIIVRVLHHSMDLEHHLNAETASLS